MRIEPGMKLKYFNGREQLIVECIKPPQPYGIVTAVQVLVPMWVTLDSIKGSAEEKQQTTNRRRLSGANTRRDVQEQQNGGEE